MGMLDPNRVIRGSGQLRLRDANIITDFFPHELMCEVEELNRDFHRQHRTATEASTSMATSADNYNELTIRLRNEDAETEQRHEKPMAPAIEFLIWHAGGSRSLPRVSSGTPTWIAVCNPAGAIPADAVAVTARLEFMKAGGGSPLIVPEAKWYAKHVSPAGNHHEGWRDSVDIGPEDEQSFIFFVSGDDNTKWVYKSPDTLVGALDTGRWEVKVVVSSDNAYGFEGKIGFLLTTHSLQPDAPEFTRLRTLKPRSRR